MNKRTRAAQEAAEVLAGEAALDREIMEAAAPLRVTAVELDRIDDGVALAPLSARRSRTLLRALLRTLGTDRPASSAETATETFGALLRQGRQRAHLDVGDVARRLHVHRDYLSGIETGARSPLALGPDGARRLVSLLGIPPGAAAVALEAAMRTALAPTAAFSARMKGGVPRETRRRILEEALPTTPEEAHLREWRDLISAVSDLASGD
jgi:transcriptional regulator with XRE-family HTH domain